MSFFDEDTESPHQDENMQNESYCYSIFFEKHNQQHHTNADDVEKYKFKNKCDYHPLKEDTNGQMK